MTRLKALILGSGGREHALAWRLSQDAEVEKVYLHPGNAGTQTMGLATLGDISTSNKEGLAQAARDQGVSLVVIGPENLLDQGYADFFRSKGFLVVGPGADGARLETSKAFAKRFMQDAGIPTASYHVETSAEGIRNRVGGTFPIVLKLDGLAAGKGVVVATCAQEMEDFIHRVWSEGEFGEDPHSIVVESFLAGKELSYIGVCDGERFVALSSASDFKRVGEGNTGPNTGGMGVVSPSPVANAQLEAVIQEQIVTPTLAQLKKLGIDYRGALYFGLMVSADGKPFVLEFNARFGDPETQALMLRLESSFSRLLLATAEKRLASIQPPAFTHRTAIYVVGCALNYPAAPRTGDVIKGLDHLDPYVPLFFSGVAACAEGGLETQGGRVLGVGGLGHDAASARDTAYSTLSRIQWDGMHFRRDIGEV